MASDNSIGVTFSHSAYLSDDGVHTGQLLVSRMLRPTVDDLVKRNHLGNGSTAIVRRECFERAGLFDETLKNCEEWELWVRIAALSKLSFRSVPEALTGYRIRAGSLSVNYSHFIANGDGVVARFRQYIDGFSDAGVRRAMAEHRRIASRKALAAGDVTISRRLLVDAIRRCPQLPLIDLRAAALSAMHVAALPFPNGFARALYRASRLVTRVIYRLFFGATASQVIIRSPERS
jgi:hypothetical protein